jgi:quercetin dioxygenase-like cupin family protein
VSIPYSNLFKTSFWAAGLLLTTWSTGLTRDPAVQPATPSGPLKQYDRAIKVEPLLVSSSTANGAPIVYPRTDRPEVRILQIEVPPGAETGWHRHPSPCYGYVISGSLTVELEDGTKMTYKAGQALAEVVNTLHNGKNTGAETAKLIMVVTGEKGSPTAVAEPKKP